MHYLDANFALARRVDSDGLDFKGLFGFPGYGGLALYWLHARLR